MDADLMREISLFTGSPKKNIANTTMAGQAKALTKPTKVSAKISAPDFIIIELGVIKRSFIFLRDYSF